MADHDRLLAREHLQIEQIRALDLEELEVEEVDYDYQDSDDDTAATGRGVAGEYTFNTCLASLHTYLGEVEDTHHRMAFLDGGAVLNLPIFYLEGVVLFPDATLPLRVIQPNFVVAIERALNQVDAPYTIGVIRVYRDPDNRSIKFANIGTTAEIRQFRRLEDGSLNVVTRGQQRFRLRRRWIDVEGAPYGEVQIIQEDVPLRAPRAAFGDLAPYSNRKGHSFPRAMPSQASRRILNGSIDLDNDSEPNSDESFESALSLREREIHRSAIEFYYGSDVMDESTSSDDEKSEYLSKGLRSKDSDSTDSLHSCPKSLVDLGNSSISEMPSPKQKDPSTCWRNTDFKHIRRVPRAFWPYWVYRMYDSYCLAQGAAGRSTFLRFTPEFPIS